MKKMDIVNPATEEVIASVLQDNRTSLDTKYSKLVAGQITWKQISLGKRIDIINNFSDLLSVHIEMLAKTLTDEVGKPLQQSRNEINGAKARIKWLTDNASKYLADEVMQQSAGLTELIRYEPLGVICNISAWNYPYLVGTNVFVPALLAGNAVMYKPSEFSTLTGQHIIRLLKEAGVPDDVIEIAIGGAETGQSLLEMAFDGYFFTGSYKTGKHIYETVAPKMVICQCELGGKDPVYITNDISDIKSAAAGTADGAFYNNGQSCCSVERIYVHADVYDAYVDEFVKEVQSWKIGDPNEEGVYIGPLSRKSQLSYLEDQVQDALKKVGTLLIGGKKIDCKGYYFEPTVLINVTHEMQVMKEESFGPIIGIMKVESDEQAVKLMKDTAYGLTASVYCNDQKRAESILNEIDSGSGYWNCCDRVSAALPWSGRKHSGFGATLSHVGMRAFTKTKGMHLRTV